jgi:hypothetical protein
MQSITSGSNKCKLRCTWQLASGIGYAKADTKPLEFESGTSVEMDGIETTTAAVA